MAPAQVTPKVSGGIVLEEEVPLGTDLDEAIGFIHPVLFWDEVIKRTKVVSLGEASEKRD
jgi:hypothetical protein